MGIMVVMEVEIGEIKATHTETTVQYASMLALKHKQKHVVLFLKQHLRK